MGLAILRTEFSLGNKRIIGQTIVMRRGSFSKGLFVSASDIGWHLRSVLLCVLIARPLQTQAQQPSQTSTNVIGPHSGGVFGFRQSGVWENGVGDGFRPTTQSLNLCAEAAYSISAFGGRQGHDLSLASFSYSRMLNQTRGVGHWHEGNPEFRLELFGGTEFPPSSQWLIGLTPHLRYDFATGTRWVPFIDGGAGVTATGIGPRDLSGTFEFNLQRTVGTQWLIEKDVTIGMEAHYFHISRAGLHSPNLGLNGVTGMLGLIYFSKL
jgi:lipid A 3-O-deacylase